VWLILDAERLTIQAANALLKTLEEPVAGTHFFLTYHQAPKHAAHHCLPP